MTSAPPTTAYRGRVRSGCLTCRSRKIKCDEAKPICKNCARLQRTCTYKPRKNQPAAHIPSPCSLDDRNPSPTLLSDPSGADHVLVRSVDIVLGPLSPESNEVHRESQHSPRSSLAETTSRLKKALQAHGDSALSSGSGQIDEDLPSILISRDIELTTTMDYLASQNEVPQSWFTYFLETVECPGITPFDPINWRLMKQHAVELGKSNPAIALATGAVSALFKAQSYALSFSGALSLYDSAKKALQSALNDDTQQFDESLVALFLLCMFELVHSENSPPLMSKQRELLVSRLESWTQQRSKHSELSIRIVIWLKIIYGITLRGGGQGLVPEEIYNLLPSYNIFPNLKPPPGERQDLLNHLLEILVAPLFDFYFRLQTISGNIAHLTHYHRSRHTGADQKAVVEQLQDIKVQLQTLWNNRCPTHSQHPDEIRSQLAPHLANHIISLIGALEAAYHAEIVELDRVLGDPVTKGSDSRKSMQAIREIVESHWNSEQIVWVENMDPAYIRPLFLYAIECRDREENLWAVQMISHMKSPIHRSDFFAAFAKALSDAQLEKDRRVTSKYFCIHNFGVPPPFM